MLTARQRIERQKAAPALVRLHHALSRLTSTVTLMHTGAHPDDEQSGLMAYCRFELGMHVVIACSTRGEGGQNALGPERGGALGVMRSREMEEAARVLDADVHWLGHGPDDPVHDFGFSKTGDGTFSHWGEERIIERLVRAYRQERPDIVLPTFLDVPGQHGHHRAMTSAAEAAIALAASPDAYPEHFREGLMPWQVAKFYLPAWSGGGDTYDDEVPPPDTTLVIGPVGYDTATGAEFDRIGEWSRAYHASQGMGYWPNVVKDTWPLHLALPNSHKETSILEALPHTLADLAMLADVSEPAARALRDAQQHIDAAIAHFPHRPLIIDQLTAAALAVAEAQELLSDDILALHGHRLSRKRAEIDAALFEAAALFERAYLVTDTLSSGEETLLHLRFGANPGKISVNIQPVLPTGAHAFAKEASERGAVFRVHIDEQADLSPLFLPDWRALGGNGPAYLSLSASFGAYKATITADLEAPLSVVPPISLTIDPPAVIVACGNESARTWSLRLTTDRAARAIDVQPVNGWSISRNGSEACLNAPQQVVPGLSVLRPNVDGLPAWRRTAISYAHIGRTEWRAPAQLQVLTLDLKRPENARIGYVGGGADTVGLWLTRMGFDVTDLKASDLAGDLSGYSTIVIGIFAFGLRPDLAAARARLHAYVEQGGHLVTLYHRPSDGWDPKNTPPRRIEIGTPSLRWRVTDPQASVTLLLPEHPLLSGPNWIDESDWAGWHKERGLYFASRWDEAYQPLLSMRDEGEQPLTGALISAQIGRGRHTHCSLVLHHQLDQLVPGAFRLMANLMQGA